MIAAILPAILPLIDKILPDKEAADRAKVELLKAEQAGELKELDSAMNNIVAEASAGGLAAQWRPITMLTFVAIIANNYIIYPYLSLFWSDAPLLHLPDQMWTLLQLGLTGYVVGRSAEKVVTNWKTTRG